MRGKWEGINGWKHVCLSAPSLANVLTPLFPEVIMHTVSVPGFKAV